MGNSGKFELSGVGVVNATPVDANGRMNEAEYRRHVRHLADSGIGFLQPAAATGQALSTSEEELRQLLEWTLDEVGDRVAVTAYTGRDGTEETIRLTKMAADVGVHCAYIIQPYFSRPDAEGLYQHYAAVAERVDIPLVFYNNPDRAGVPIPISVMQRLADQYDQFVGLKQADLLAFADSFSALSGKLQVMPKSEKEMIFGYSLGSTAVLTFAGNIVPNELVDIHRNWANGNLDAARKTYLEVLELFNIIHIEPVPGAIKHMLNKMGWDFGPPRLPGHTLSADSAKRVEDVLSRLRLI